MIDVTCSSDDRRETLHVLMHAAANLKLLAKCPDFHGQALTHFLAKQIDDWCLKVVPAIDPPVVRECVNDDRKPDRLRVVSDLRNDNIA